MAIEQRPINMDKVREKLAKLQNPGGFKRNPDKWSPKQLKKGEVKGEISTIRIIRNPFDEDPFLERHFHYNVGTGEKSSFLCLKRNYSKDCPACEYASFLWNSESDDDKELAKGLFARTRQHAVCVDREDEEPTPRWWGFGVGVYDILVQKLEHPEYSGFLDYYEGIDLEINYWKENVKKRYPNTAVNFSRRNSALAGSDAEIQKILDKIKNPEEVFKPLTKSQIDEQLNAWLATNESAEGGSAETVKGGNGSVVASTDDLTKEEEKPFSEADVSKAFESLGTVVDTDDDVPL